MSAKKMTGAMKKAAGTEENVQFYDRLIATRKEIERKGDANPYTAVNGNMFTLLLGSKTLGIRLPEAEREQFMKKYGATLLEAYGAVMKEYVAVPDRLLRETKELKKYLDLSFEYAMTLKPKASTKTKKK